MSNEKRDMKKSIFKKTVLMTNKRLTGITVRVLMAFLISHSSFFIPASAQSFTERIQKTVSGQGTVTIHQSDSINRLVNSAVLSTAAPATKPGDTGNAKNSGISGTPGKSGKSGNSSTSGNTGSTVTSDTSENADDAPDTSKKIMRGVKVLGFRVQAFAGGNSRKDRQRAEQVGNDIKANYPNVPVYVHFYSPRWICRVGNYRTYEEAHQMLLSIRNLGYKEASIVKGKVTVQY